MEWRFRELSPEERVKIETTAGEEHSVKSIAPRRGRVQSTTWRSWCAIGRATSVGPANMTSG